MLTLPASAQVTANVSLPPEVARPAAGATENLVPLGTYRLRYASGETWRGETHLFGPGDLKSYSASESIFTFEVSGGYVNGYTVELIQQVGGNMDTRNINLSEF
jgi:hypothetical protein